LSKCTGWVQRVGAEGECRGWVQRVVRGLGNCSKFSLYFVSKSIQSLQILLWSKLTLVCSSHNKNYIQPRNTEFHRNTFAIDLWLYNFYKKLYSLHSSMPSPLAPDPIRVQSCVCCLFWTNRNSMVVTSIFLSISLSNQSYDSFNRRYQ